jgi:hypothetical protein
MAPRFCAEPCIAAIVPGAKIPARLWSRSVRIAFTLVAACVAVAACTGSRDVSSTPPTVSYKVTGSNVTQVNVKAQNYCARLGRSALFQGLQLGPSDKVAVYSWRARRRRAVSRRRSSAVASRRAHRRGSRTEGQVASLPRSLHVPAAPCSRGSPRGGETADARRYANSLASDDIRSATMKKGLAR